MSIHVLKRKMNEKAKLNKQNQYASARGDPFALNMTNRGSVRSNPVMGQVNMSGFCGEGIRKHANPKSYFNYNRRTFGLGNLSSRMYNVQSNGLVTRITHKSAPEVDQSQYLKNKKTEEMRCDHVHTQCNKAPYVAGSTMKTYVLKTCYNNCDSGNGSTTKNLGFMSSSEHLQKRLSYRKMVGKFEEPLMNSGNCSIIN